MSSAAPNAKGAASFSHTTHWRRSKLIRTTVPRRRVNASQTSTNAPLTTLAPTYQSKEPIPARVTVSVRAKLPIWPTTLEIATSRSHNRASNNRMRPNATERMIRLRPPSAVPMMIRVSKFPTTTHTIATA